VFRFGSKFDVQEFEVRGSTFLEPSTELEHEPRRENREV